MQLNQQQFIPHLKGPLLPVYLLSGDTPLLRQEARDALRQAASNAGYTNHQRFTVDTGFVDLWKSFNPRGEIYPTLD